jgi:hypothetical protein
MCDRENAMIELVFAIAFIQEATRIPTWTEDIQGIIFNSCMPCHDTGGAGAFHLLTYEDVAGRASFIVELTSSGIMPPWIPDDFGLALRHKRGIPKKDIETIQKWIDAGKPKGETPEIVVCGGGLIYPDATGRTQREMNWIIPAESEVRWHKGIRDKQTFVLPINNVEPMKVTSIQFKTTAPRAVQMVGFVLDHQGRGRIFDSWDPDELGYEMMGDIGWVPSGTHGKIGPGNGTVQLPKGFHWEIPANVDLIAETHFRPRGKQETLSCSVAIQTKPTKDSRPIQEIVTMVRRVYIEAEDDSFEIGETIEVPVAVDVIGITPRAGAECSSMKITSGDTTLLSIPSWDSHYGETVFFKVPFRLEKGSTIDSLWKYNNSETNPRNPFVPSQLVDLARKTGIANFILHVALVNKEDSETLSKWNLSLLRKRQRAIQ